MREPRTPPPTGHRSPVRSIALIAAAVVAASFLAAAPWDLLRSPRPDPGAVVETDAPRKDKTTDGPKHGQRKPPDRKRRPPAGKEGARPRRRRAKGIRIGPDTPGRWARAPKRSSPPDSKPLPGMVDADVDSKMRSLESIGYLAGSLPPPPSSGITIHDPSRAWHGLNLLSSGHQPGAILMTMDGETIHEWHCDMKRAFAATPEGAPSNHREFWRRVRLLPNGDVLAVFEGNGIIRLDAASRVVWAAANQAHHDVCYLPDTHSLLVLTREPVVNPQMDPSDPVLDNYLAFLDPDSGETLRRLSLIDAILDSPYAPVFLRGNRSGDVLHCNTIEPLDGSLASRCAAFRKGNVLLCSRTQDFLFVLDPDAGAVVWGQAGMWHRPHEPRVLPNGHLLLFDNLGLVTQSRVWEFDPFTQQVAWSYVGSESEPFLSRTCGAAQRLPNGNTLITETDPGRAFEVTREGLVVWEYVNPHRTGDRNQLIASLFEVNRLPLDFPTNWMGAAAGDAATGSASGPSTPERSAAATSAGAP